MDANLLSQAIELATTMHAGQMDEDGNPHILHALEVMFGTRDMSQDAHNYGYDGTLEDLMIAAVLHDTVEDTPVTLSDIEQKFGKVVRDLVDGVTRRGLGEGETKEFYRDFIYRAKANPGSRIIKIADLVHNLSRSHKIKKASWREKLLFKYSIALRVLNDLDEPTWERASYSATYDGTTARYFTADPNGKKIEIPEEKFKAFVGK